MRFMMRYLSPYFLLQLLTLDNDEYARRTKIFFFFFFDGGLKYRDA